MAIVPQGLPYDLIDKQVKPTEQQLTELAEKPLEWFKLVSEAAMGKKQISNLLNSCYRDLGLKDTVVFADQLMYRFHYAALSGVSVGINDMLIPDAKKSIIDAAESEVSDIQEQFFSGW